MKTRLLFLVCMVLVAGNPAFGQPGQGDFRPPGSQGESRKAASSVELNTKRAFSDSSQSVAGKPLGENLDLKDSPDRSWRTYDISGFTTTVKSVANPEKNVLDWILRETGTGIWFGESAGVLSVGRHKVRCYHTAAIQQKVRTVVDRFNKTKEMDEVFGFQLITVGNPNWRAKSLRLMNRIETQSPGVEGWLATKENAAQLYNDLRKRSDFNLPISQNLVTESGQPKKIIRQKPVNYFRSIVFDQRNLPPFRVETAKINEGFVIHFSPLRSLDGNEMDAEIFCSVDQLEQFRQVNVDVPTPNGNYQKYPISVPQLSSWRLKERFKWPDDRVLILSVGVVASPDRNMKTRVMIQDVFEPNSKRADALIFVDCKGLFVRGQTPKSAYQMVPLQNRR
ncbi:MAG: hypothetical protein VX438_11630 [Planctomycetota bacterium]|nr:hypothetical protein [Planctomycetota bacterium]